MRRKISPIVLRSACGELARRFDSFTLDAFGKSLVDRFRSAIPTDWRPKSQYEVMTKVPARQEMREWLESIPVPNGMALPDYSEMSNDQVKGVLRAVCLRHSDSL